MSNRFFCGLRLDGHISEKDRKYFLYEYKRLNNLGKLYFLPMIHTRLYDVPGRTVVSNCDSPTEKVSEFLYLHLKPIMQEGWSYIKDTEDFKESSKYGKNSSRFYLGDS